MCRRVEADAQHRHGDDDVAVSPDIRIAAGKLREQRDDKIRDRGSEGIDE
jgi:hypothetical protein